MSLNNHRSGKRVQLIDGWGFVVVSGAPDRRIVTIAERQRGRVARRQLLAAELTPAEIRSRLQRGQLVAEHYGVYGVAPLLNVALARETAALLACGPAVALCGWDAGAAWELMAPPGPKRPVDIAVLDGSDRGRMLAGIKVHRYATLTSRDVTRFQGLPIVTPQWALLEVAARLTRREVERALDEGLAKHRLSPSKVRELVDRVGTGRPGASILRELVGTPRRLTITQNDKEEKVLPLVRAADLADPVCQAPLHGYLVDFYWPEASFGLEVDSMWHATRTNMRRDRTKDARLRDRGIEIMRWMWEDLDDDPIAFVAHLVRQIERRLAGRRKAA